MMDKEYSLQDYLLLFQNTNVQLNGNNSMINFMNDNYTISDITECKRFLKETMNRKSGSNVLKNTEFLNKGEKMLTENLIKGNTKSNVNSVYVTPVKHDNQINILEKPIYDNIVNIDTQYVTANTSPIVTKKTNDLTVKLSEPINNVCELTLNSIQIPYTFYNISETRKNNTFIIYIGELELEYVVSLNDGHYENVSNIINEINTILNKHNALSGKIEFIQNENTKRVYVVNNTNYNLIFDFYHHDPKYENLFGLHCSLGWCLGYRGVEAVLLNGKENYVSQLSMEANSEVYFTGSAIVPNQKYFVLCLDDFTKSQNDKSLITTNQQNLIIKPKIYPMNDKNMNCINCENVDDFKGKYTKAEQYSQIEILRNKQNNSTNLIHNSLNVNNVLAIIPFNSILNSAEFSHMITFDSSYFMKKNRKYFGPVDLNKIKFTLYDDNGNIVDFNGCDWNFSVVASSLYKK